LLFAISSWLSFVGWCPDRLREQLETEKRIREDAEKKFREVQVPICDYVGSRNSSIDFSADVEVSLGPFALRV
jgi:hypothetical protein